MRRRIHRSDGNQAEIVDDLRRAGVAVYVLGQPLDLLCWHAACGYYLLEVKNPDGLNRLTPAQKRFRETWAGPWHVIRSAEDGLRAMGLVL